MQDNGRYASGSSRSGQAPQRQAPSRQPQRQPERQPQRQPERISQRRQKPPKEGGGGGRWFRAIIMVAATLAGCVFLSFFILRSAMDLFGLNQEDNAVNIRIPDGSGIQEVAEILADKEIVDQPFTFRVYASLKLEDEEVKPGDYLFNANMGYDQIIVALRMGNTEIKEVTLTFIEGTTLYETARKLEENNVCKADDFLDYLQTGELDYEFMDRMPNNAYRFRRMEGYVFPDTYNFYENEKVANVAAKFLNNFESKITESMELRMQQLNMTLDETIILASIIQKEADTSDQMKRVSAVFHNRLNRNDLFPNLQSDVTIHYVERFIKPFLTSTDQEMYDAYNTYVGTGLPPGAICNPGFDAIDAALNPADTDNYFFVTDSEGLYYYAESLEQHNRNVAEAFSVGGKDIHGTQTQ